MDDLDDLFTKYGFTLLDVDLWLREAYSTTMAVESYLFRTRCPCGKVEMLQITLVYELDGLPEGYVELDVSFRVEGALIDHLEADRAAGLLA